MTPARPKFKKDTHQEVGDEIKHCIGRLTMLLANLNIDFSYGDVMARHAKTHTFDAIQILNSLRSEMDKIARRDLSAEEYDKRMYIGPEQVKND